MEKHNIPTVLLKAPLLTRTPRGDIKCQLSCSRVKIILSGVEFLADLVVLKSKGTDVILGMDWLSHHDGLISCADKVMHLTNPNGVQVACHTRKSRSNIMVFSMETKHIEEVLIVREYQMCSLNNSPKCHQIGMQSYVLPHPQNLAHSQETL
jgi:hypothetical protein